MTQPTAPHPALLSLIDALAAQAARDYLTRQAAQDNAPAPECSNHPGLPPVDEAA
ncbi:MAG TPA: hypothetical protein VF216_03085 [Mizugakiibacter sp.]